MALKAKVVAKIAILKELQKLKNESQNKKIINRKYWVKPLLMKRCDFDIEAHLLKDLLWQDDDSDFNNFCRLNVHRFEEILNLVSIISHGNFILIFFVYTRFMKS